MLPLKIHWWWTTTCNFLVLKLRLSPYYLFSMQIKQISAPSAELTATSFPAMASPSFSAPAQALQHSWLCCPRSSTPRAQHWEPHTPPAQPWGHSNNHSALSLRVLHSTHLLTHLSEIIMIHIQFLLPWSFSTAGVMSQLFPKIVLVLLNSPLKVQCSAFLWLSSSNITSLRISKLFWLLILTTETLANIPKLGALPKCCKHILYSILTSKYELHM